MPLHEVATVVEIVSLFRPNSFSVLPVLELDTSDACKEILHFKLSQVQVF